LQPLFIAQQDRVPIAPSFDVQPLLRTRQRSSELWPVMRVCAISGRDRPSARSLGVKRYIVMATVNRPYPADRREIRRRDATRVWAETEAGRTIILMPVSPKTSSGSA